MLSEVCNSFCVQGESEIFLTNFKMDNSNMVKFAQYLGTVFTLKYQFRFDRASRAENERESMTSPPKAPLTKKTAKQK